MLFYKNLELSLKLGLLRVVGLAIAVCRETGHILDNQQAKLVACLVKQMRLVFDLLKSVRDIEITRLY